MTEDFEELVSLDEKWEDWFQNGYGTRRLDGKPPVDFATFKADLAWILTEKLGDTYVALIQKYEEDGIMNGMRAYKKLYIWSIDVSHEVQHENMKYIMYPSAAKNNGLLADAIEKWDQDQKDLRIMDPSAVLVDPWRLVAFKMIFTPDAKKLVDEQLDHSQQKDYDLVRKRVYPWALRNRQTERESKFPSGINNIEPGATPPEGQEYPPGGYSPEQAQQWGGGYGSWDPSMSAMGPGKGQFMPRKGNPGNKGGKGGKGKGCFNCGAPDHYKANCPYPPKGKAKGGKQGPGKSGGKGKWGSKGPKGPPRGKGAYGLEHESQGVVPPEQQQAPQDLNLADGGFQGYCHGCNEWGHMQRNCPYNTTQWKQPGAAGAAGTNSGPPGAADKAAGVKFGPDGKPLSSLTMSLGGKTEEVPPECQDPETRDLKSVCENAGWFIRDKKGSARPRCPAWLPADLFALDKAPEPVPVTEYALQQPRADGETKEIPLQFTPNDLQTFKQLRQKTRRNKKKMRYIQHVCDCGDMHTMNTCCDECEGESAGVKDLNAVDRKEEPVSEMTWTTLKMTMDSGACDHVVHPKELKTVQVKKTAASGTSYMSASGNEIKNLGEADINAYTPEGYHLELAVQLAEVNKNLAAVRKICSAGNRVVFDDDFGGGYVENKTTGIRIPIEKDQGTYAVTLKVLVPKDMQEINNVDESEEVSFTRHD